MGKVAHKVVKAKGHQSFLEEVEEVMLQADWKHHIKGKKIFIKPNCLSDQLVPGQCTSPWVLEGVIRVLKKDLPESKIYVGDADVATARQVEKCAQIWGFKDICRRYGCKFVNLSKQKTILANLKGEIFKKMDMPKILLDVDCIITIPVMKTHNVTTMTCSLKNQWGCLPRVRHQYHLVADKCIPEINKFLKVTFAVADATICLEENGPRVGRPRIVGSLMASADRVALDSAACDIMGIDPNKVGHIVHAEKIDVGKMEYSLNGDPLPHLKFKPALVDNHPIVKWELRLRKIPVLSYLIFNTPFFKIPAFFAAKYNSIWWYQTKGKRWAKKVIKKSKLYYGEFAPLLKRIGKL